MEESRKHQPPPLALDFLTPSRFEFLFRILTEQYFFEQYLFIGKKQKILPIFCKIKFTPLPYQKVPQIDFDGFKNIRDQVNKVARAKRASVQSFTGTVPHVTELCGTLGAPRRVPDGGRWATPRLAPLFKLQLQTYHKPHILEEA